MLTLSVAQRHSGSSSTSSQRGSATQRCHASRHAPSRTASPPLTRASSLLQRTW